MYLRIFRDPVLRPLLGSAVVDYFGDAAAMIGFLLVAYGHTHSAVQVSGVALAEALPYLLLGLVGGAAADSVPRLPLVITADSVRAVLQAGLFAMFLVGDPPYALLIGVVALINVGGCFANPAARAVLPDVCATDILPTANAVLDAGRTAAMLLAPIVAGTLAASGWISGLFLIDSVTYIVGAAGAAVALHRTVVSTHRHSLGGPSRLKHRVRAFLATATAPGLLRTLLVTTFCVVTATTWARQIGMLILAGHGTRNGNVIYSIIAATVAAAAVAAAVVFPRLVRRPTVSHYSAGAVVWGVGTALPVTGAHVPILLAAAVMQGAGTAIAGASRSFVLQTELPAAIRGQGFAAAATLLYLADVVSIAAFGAAAVAIPTSILMLAGGVIAMGGGAAALTFGRRRQRSTHPSTITPDESSAHRKDDHDAHPRNLGEPEAGLLQHAVAACCGGVGTKRR